MNRSEVAVRPGSDPDVLLRSADRMLAEVATAEDAANLMDYAEAARVFAQRAKLGTSAINHATAIKLKAQRRLAEHVDAGQARGQIAKPEDPGPGRGKTVMPADRFPKQSLSDLGVSKQLVNESRLVAEALPSDAAVDAVVAEANAADKELSRKQIITDARTKRRREKKQKIADSKPAPVPVGPFDLILADPPWTYAENVADATRVLDNHYPTMTMDELKAMSVPAANDCVLLMWATSPLLPQQIEVMRAWGFEYRTCAVWVKDRPGMGMYWRQAHELLLLGVRGKPGTPEPADRPSSVITAPRVEHSRKPDEVHAMAEAMFGHLPRRVELFARRPRDGWNVWEGKNA